MISPFCGGLGLDSIDALELIVLLQQQYNIKLNNAEEGPKVFQTVRTMAEYIKAQHRLRLVCIKKVQQFMWQVWVLFPLLATIQECCLHALENGQPAWADYFS